MTNALHDKERKEAFERLYHNLSDESPDVTLVSEDLQQVPAHGVILSLASPLLASLLRKEARTVIFLAGVKENLLRALVSFVYVGSAQVNQEEKDDFNRLLADFRIQNQIDTNLQNPDHKTYVISLEPVEKNTTKRKGNKPPEKEYIPDDAEPADQNTEKQPADTEDCEPACFVKELSAKANNIETITAARIETLDKNLRPSTKLNIQDKKIDARTCSYCNTSISRKTFDFHLTNVHGDLMIPCNTCGKNIIKAKLRWHIKIAHETILPKKFCGIEECQFEYTTKQELQKHKRKNHNDHFQCDQCEFSTHGDYELKKHVREKHEKHEIVKYQCEYCSQIFSKKENLNRHKRVKHEGKRAPCPHCEYQATSAYNLQVHIEARHELKRAYCEICDFSCSQGAKLRCHMKQKHI